MLKRIDKTGPRTDLAKAIESRDAAAKRVDELRGSIERIEDERFEARQRLDATRAAAQDVDQDNETDEVIRRLVAGDTGAALLTRTDRKAEAEAGRAIETCNAALNILRPELSDAERSLDLRTSRVRDAAGAVIAAEALDAMIADTERLHGEIEARQSVLSFLHPLISREQKTKVERVLASSHAHVPHPALDQWRTALEALMADASAELPR